MVKLTKDWKSKNCYEEPFLQYVRLNK